MLELRRLGPKKCDPANPKVEAHQTMGILDQNDKGSDNTRDWFDMPYDDHDRNRYQHRTPG